MSLGIRINIQKREKVIVFRYFVTGNFAVDYFGEDACHEKSLRFQVQDCFTTTVYCNRLPLTAYQKLPRNLQYIKLKSPVRYVYLGGVAYFFA
jgi:hypothetical protein